MKRTATSPTVPPKRSRLSGIFTNILIICNINNITHIQQDSIFDGKTFTERFNMPVFDKMVTCAQLRENPLEYKRWTKGQKKDNIDNERIQFQKLKDRIQDGQLNVSYRPSSHHWGRYCAKGGITLGLIRGVLRNSIARENYYDIDMKNCHPTILCQLCKHHGIPCPLLERYVTNREPWLQRLMTTHAISRGDAKELIIALTNGKKYGKWMKGNYVVKKGMKGYNGSKRIWENWHYIDERSGDKDPQTMQYAQEMKDITKKIKDKNQEFYTAVTASKSHNKNGTFMAIYLQEWERRLLEITFLYLKNRGVIGEHNDCVLCYDGIMILKSKVPDPNTLCKELQMHMLASTGFNIIFEEKPMNDCVEITEDPNYIPSYSVETVEVQYHCPDMDVLRKKYPMTGEFERVNNNTFKAFGDWTCPFGIQHTQSRFITFHEHHGYCKGCNKLFHAIDPDCTDAGLKETKKKIIDELT